MEILPLHPPHYHHLKDSNPTLPIAETINNWWAEIWKHHGIHEHQGDSQLKKFFKEHFFKSNITKRRKLDIFMDIIDIYCWFFVCRWVGKSTKKQRDCSQDRNIINKNAFREIKYFYRHAQRQTPCCILYRIQQENQICRCKNKLL